ncbi:MAG: hypothetical protein FJ405_00705 [Verrucomicrobia bacterium]|nr:hypothetical protein [Verrucomicrobiota bacterium]
MSGRAVRQGAFGRSGLVWLLLQYGEHSIKIPRLLHHNRAGVGGLQQQLPAQDEQAQPAHDGRRPPQASQPFTQRPVPPRDQ